MIKIKNRLRRDALAHPDPTKFDLWAENGVCFGLGLWGFVSWLGLLLLASIAAHCCTYE
jgi:hypothetical protein